jgi:hypothetical protein
MAEAVAPIAHVIAVRALQFAQQEVASPVFRRWRQRLPAARSP